MPRKKKWLLYAMDATLKLYAVVGFRANSMTKLFVSLFSSVVPGQVIVSPYLKQRRSAIDAAIAIQGRMGGVVHTVGGRVQLIHHQLLVVGIRNLEPLGAKQPRYSLFLEHRVVVERRDGVRGAERLGGDAFLHGCQFTQSTHHATTPSEQLTAGAPAKDCTAPGRRSNERNIMTAVCVQLRKQMAVWQTSALAELFSPYGRRESASALRDGQPIMTRPGQRRSTSSNHASACSTARMFHTLSPCRKGIATRCEESYGLC